MRQIDQVLKALREGPGTSQELALELGWPVKHVSHYLTQLSKLGLIRPSGTVPMEPRKSGHFAHVKRYIRVWEPV